MLVRLYLSYNLINNMLVRLYLSYNLINNDMLVRLYLSYNLINNVGFKYIYPIQIIFLQIYLPHIGDYYLSW